MQANAEINEIQFPVPDFSKGSGDFVGTLADRLHECSAQHPNEFLFITPTIILRCSEVNREFLDRCEFEERKWRRHVVHIVGPSAASRPQSFGLASQHDFNSQTCWKREKSYQWTMTCRGNMFGPNDIYPNDHWREISTLTRSPQSSGGDAFRALVRSFATLNTELQVGIELSKYVERLHRLAVRIKSAAEWDRTPQGIRLAELFRELREIHLDAAKVWEVKLDIPVLRAEARKMQKRFNIGSSKFDTLIEFRTQATLNGIPLQDHLQNRTGLDVIAQRYALPITATESGFTIIPMDSVDRIVAVAREKKHEIAALRTTR